MTSINAGGYGVIYLTSNHMADFSNGNAVIKFDLSTEKMSGRDWWDISVSPFEDAQALPLLSDLSQGVDLQEPNKNSIVIATDNGEGGPNLKIMRNGVREDYDGVNGYFNIPANEGITAGTNQAATRQPFQLTISKTHIRFERLATATGQAVVFVDTDIPALAWSQGVIQLGHHSYNPFKDDSGVAATWHWDSVNISPSIPFTMIKADRRFTEGGVVNFNSPAPANAYLRFSGACAILVDGVRATKQTDSGHPEHMSSYFIPIAQGKKSVDITFADDSWYTTGFGCIAKDFAIWSTTADGSAPQPSATPTTIVPTNTPTPPTNVSPTLTPSPTPTKTPTPTPTKTPTPTPTRTLTPTPTKSPVPTPTPTQVIPPTPVPSIQGLNGRYFNNSNFTSFATSRVDSNIGFDWYTGSPNVSMGADTFSARWTGKLLVPETNSYTIYTVSDDGVRVWIDGNRIINNWRDHAATENKKTISLSQGAHSIRVDFYENRGLATMKLLWSSPSISKQIIPTQNFTP